jgi:hypothetical protein
MPYWICNMTVRRRFVAYYRVSTQQQGRSGLGLAAQQEAVCKHVSSVAGELVDAFEEVETGKLNSRPALAQALAACRALHATLIIAKLDRLARNAAFLLSVVEGSGRGVWCSATCLRSRQDHPASSSSPSWRRSPSWKQG